MNQLHWLFLTEEIIIHITIYFQEEVEQYYAEKQITIEGHNCPRPCIFFEEANFPSKYVFTFNLKVNLLMGLSFEINLWLVVTLQSSDI